MPLMLFGEFYDCGGESTHTNDVRMRLSNMLHGAIATTTTNYCFARKWGQLNTRLDGRKKCLHVMTCLIQL